MRDSPTESRYREVRTTTDDHDEALRLVRGAVERRLAACGQVVGPIRSIYRWRGAVQDEREWLCLLKTTSERASSLIAFLEDEHSYEVPEVVATSLTAVSEAYGEWIDEETTD